MCGESSCAVRWGEEDAFGGAFNEEDNSNEDGADTDELALAEAKAVATSATRCTDGTRPLEERALLSHLEKGPARVTSQNGASDAATLCSSVHLAARFSR